jgi:WD40 repeat protein
MQNQITVLKIDKDEKYSFAGSKFGSLYIFKVNEHHWTQHGLLLDHTDEITSICISNVLNIFASSSLDGFINLYTFPESKLFRSIKLNNYTPIDEVYTSITLGIFECLPNTMCCCLFQTNQISINI